MRDKILFDLTSAMKNQDKETLSVLRMVKGSMQLEEINKKRSLNDEEMTQLISKQIKTRKESIVEFEKGHRDDLIEQNKKEIAILEKYMPTLMSEEEINKIVTDLFSQLNPSANEMGKIMGAITPLVKGKADMSLVNKIVKDKLGSL
jgi:uncharacterized protein